MSTTVFADRVCSALQPYSEDILPLARLVRAEKWTAAAELATARKARLADSNPYHSIMLAIIAFAVGDSAIANYWLDGVSGDLGREMRAYSHGYSTALKNNMGPPPRPY